MPNARRRSATSKACGGDNVVMPPFKVTPMTDTATSFFITAGQVSDYAGAVAPLDDLPKAKWMLADRGCNTAWYRNAPQAKGITPCIPAR